MKVRWTRDMIKLATVFSGIGSIEHALKRMMIPYEIVFACDNGDVDILSKNVLPEINDIELELILLNKMVEKIKNTKGNDKEYTTELENNLRQLEDDYKIFLDTLMIQQELINFVKLLLSKFIEGDYFNDNVQKVYKEWIDILIDESYSQNHKITEAEKAIIKVESDYKRIYGKNFLESEVFLSLKEKETFINLVNVSEFKKRVKAIREISEGLSMLHEKINTFYILKELNNIESYDAKKEYVDKLYEGRENQNKVKQTYLENYDIDKKHFHWNASFLDGNQYKNKVDLFVGGSPCQSFSLVGKQRGLEDTRGTLFYEFARLINEIQPKVFIYENVKAVLSNDNGNTWRTMCDIFDNLNYNWYQDILNARDYGIPQNRERLFVVGFRKDLGVEDFKFPKQIELKKTMKDFLMDNVSGKYYLPQKGVAFVTDEKNLNKRYTQINGDIQLCQKKNQQFNWHGDFVFEEINNDKEKLMDDLEKYFLSEKVEKYVMSSGTKGFYSKPKIDLDVARPLLTSMHKMHRAGVDNYVTTEGRIRKLTPRECLRLMGYCDSFKIVVSDTSMYQQAGNSIVVDVLIHIINEVIRVYPNLCEQEVNN